MKISYVVPYLLVGGVLNAGAATAEPLKIVTDLPAVASLSAQVMGEVPSDITNILKLGDDVHHYSLRPSQAQSVVEADAVFWIGPGLTPWFETAIETLNPDVNAEPLDVHSEAHHDDHEDHEDEHKEGHDDHEDEHKDDHDDHDNHDDHKEEGETHEAHAHEGGDPHSWLDPQAMQEWVQHMSEEVIELLPDSTAEIEQNRDNAVSAMMKLEADIVDILAPVEGASFVAMHDAYSIFADRFGLTILENLTPHDDAAPSAKQMSKMRDTIKTQSPACLLARVGESDKLIATVVEGFDISVAVVDIVGSDSGPSGYSDMMTKLAKDIAQCAS